MYVMIEYIIKDNIYIYNTRYKDNNNYTYIFNYYFLKY